MLPSLVPSPMFPWSNCSHSIAYISAWAQQMGLLCEQFDHGRAVGAGAAGEAIASPLFDQI